MEVDKIIHGISDLAADVFERPGSIETVCAFERKGLGFINPGAAEIEKQFSFKDLASIMPIGNLVDMIKTKIKENLGNKA